jgi:hypothetical protein
VGTVDTPRSQAAYGFLADAGAVELSDVSISALNPFAVVAVTSLDGKDIAVSDRLLVTAVGRAENTGMVYNLTHTKLHDAGGGPILIEPITGQVTIDNSNVSFMIYAVGPDGSRTPLGGQLPSPDGLVLDLAAEAGTIYYEIVGLPNRDVILEVHPNERAPGPGGAPRIGGVPWQPSGLGPGAWYEWKVYHFDGSDSLWIQVCAQSFSAAQNAVNAADKLRMRIDGLIPSDVWGLMSGPPGIYQWLGSSDGGQRWALEFQPSGLSAGPHSLVFEAKETPIIRWVKVCEQ